MLVDDKNWSNRLFNTVNYSLLTLVSLITIIPFVYIVSMSFASPGEVAKGGLLLFPSKFTLGAYKYIFSTDTMVRSILISIYITVFGTLINLLLTSFTAYPLAKATLRGRRTILLMVLITMLFSGGLIPTYFVVKAFGMINTYWSLMIPTAISAFNLIVLKNFFQQIPDSLVDSAKIDGCNDLGILFRIILPLSMPAMATFGLFYAVGHWNTFFNAVMYMNDAEKFPVQVILRQIVLLSQDQIGNTTSQQDPTDYLPQTIRMASIVVATVPIVLVYPFLQKHFAKGVLLGSVKG
ncbi:putative aldouronate transport system permease protein [Paenibacillus sp. V4I3]|uniref:carbohydrate ABC transporter permease n=1 Tax=unclassified Paenibacillus TaxID=185978 RepID=UPI002783A8C4|nr:MULTISPECIES: carbohydrate ABC transporter permease [unclassified Paenibacillus]MDQ0877579.1 putative aldouronate transport system permease protein [Paenibacillus sp. V4I3]MDQ0886556.1 putative aldouronate transport system permease protein [Paenibacillus sp. V4I9]